MRKNMDNWLILYWTLFFGAVLFTGSATNYLHPKLHWLLWAGFAVLAATLAVGLFARGTPYSHSCDVHGKNETAEGATAPFAKMFYHALPIVLFAVLAVCGKQTLGVDSMKNKMTVFKSLPAVVAQGRATDVDNAGYIRTDVLDIIQNREYHSGEPRVSLSGMVYIVKDTDSIPGGLDREEYRIIIIRYLMTCCAADAQPISVVLDGIDPGGLKNGEWYGVRGTSELIHEGLFIPRIIVHEISHIPEPVNPYIYP